MSQHCPVCGGVIEHVRRERPQDPSSHPEAIPGPNAAIEVDDLCTADGDDQWDRICHRAAVERGNGSMVPVLEVFYHFFDDEAEQSE